MKNVGDSLKALNQWFPNWG